AAVVGGEQVIRDGIVDDARHDLPVYGRGDTHAPQGDAAGEVRGAVYRIDEPGDVAAAGLAALLADDAGSGGVAIDDLADAFFGAPVEHRHRIVEVALVVDDQSAGTKSAERDGARAARRRLGDAGEIRDRCRHAAVGSSENCGEERSSAAVR